MKKETLHSTREYLVSDRYQVSDKKKKNIIMKINIVGNGNL